MSGSNRDDLPVCRECGQASLRFFPKKKQWRCGNEECGEVFAGSEVDVPERIQNSTRTDAAIDRLPSILALPLKEYAREQEPVLKLWLACDVVELLLRFAVTVGVAELRRLHGEIPAELVKELRPRIEEPTLGKWKLMALAVAKRLGKAAAVVPELADLVEREVVPFLDGDGSRRTVDTAFSAVRNQLAHGGGVTRGAAGRLLLQWGPRFEVLLAGLNWLGELLLVVRRTDGSLGLLQGPQRLPGVYFAATPAIKAALEAAFQQGEEVVLVRGQAVLPLWPLTVYGVPRSPDPAGVQALEAVPQIYVRRGEVRLQLTAVGSDEVCQSEADETALDAFLAFFRLRELEVEARAKGYQVRGFEGEIQKDAGRLVGRAEELEMVRRTLRDANEGVFWLTGPAGIGKSYLAARIAAEILGEPPIRTLVLAYRFKAGDHRCSRGRFLQYAIERITDWEGLVPQENDEGLRSQGPLDELKGLLGRVAQGSRLLLILDGLDEVAERDATFAAEVPLALGYPGVVWVCAGRPERGLSEDFSPERCTHLFPRGVPPMGTGDIRTMLLEKIGPLRKRLLKNDREEGEAVVNPFVERVAVRAQGLPIYVTYVIGDILSNRYRALDAGERLPPSLGKYHEELLKRCAVGELHQVLTPLVSLLAVAKEPLGIEALAELLVHCNVLTANDEPEALVRRGLSAVASMLRRATTPEGGDGYTLFHHSLREHMGSSAEMRVPLATRRQDLCRLTAEPGGRESPAAAYLCRWGVTHLIEAADREAALSLLMGFDYLMNRLQVLPGPVGVRGVSEDWRLVQQGGVLEGDSAIWEEFWRTRDHLLAQGDEIWPTHRILLQLGWDHAAKSPVTQQAEAWVAKGNCNWTWMSLDLRDRPTDVQKSACLFTMMGHGGSVNCCAITDDGKTAVTGSGHPLLPKLERAVRIWDLEGQRCVRVLHGHEGEVLSVAITPDAKLAASGSADGTVRVWDVVTGECQHVFDCLGGQICAVTVAPDGSRGLAAARTGLIHALQLDAPRTTRCLSEGGRAVTALACDEGWTIAVFGRDDGTVNCLDLETETCSDELSGLPEAVSAIALSRHGRFVVIGRQDGHVNVWDRSVARLVRDWENPPDSVSVVAITADDRYVLAGYDAGNGREDVVDTSLRMWELATGRLVKRFFGHSRSIYGLSVPRDPARSLTASEDGAVKLWDLDVPGEQLKTQADWGFIDHVTAAHDGTRVVMASEDGKVRVWDLDERRIAKVFPCHDYVAWAGEITPDGRRLVSSSEDHTVRVWATDTSRCLHSLSGHNDPVNTVTVSPDGRFAVSGSGNGSATPVDCSARVWDLELGKCLHVFQGHELQIEQALITPDGRVALTSGWDNRLHLWDMESGRRLRTLVNRGLDLRGIALTPDGRWCACGNKSGNVRVWDIRCNICLLDCKGHDDYIRRASISRDGRILATGGDDGRLRYWDLETMCLLSSASFPGWVTSVAFLGATHRCVVGLSDGQMLVTQVENDPAPGVPVVTAVRLWRFGSDEATPGSWDESLTSACPWCGGRFVPTPCVLEALFSATGYVGTERLPCLELPDAAWQDAALLSSCCLCGRALRFNPFYADARRSPHGRLV